MPTAIKDSEMPDHFARKEIVRLDVRLEAHMEACEGHAQAQLDAHNEIKNAMKTAIKAILIMGSGALAGLGTIVWKLLQVQIFGVAPF